MTKYIIVFAQIYEDFRLAELKALNTLLDLSLTYDLPCDVTRPYMVVNMPSEVQARRLGSRAVLVKQILEHWADAEDYNKLHEENRANSKIWASYKPVSVSFKITVTAYQCTIPSPAQVQLINDLSYMDFEGPIKLKDPDLEVVLSEEHRRDPKLGPPSKKGERDLRRIWLGKKVCEGQRHLIDIFDLKKRAYIGNTSMEAGLSLLMSNQAQVKPGHLVLDPFCGTGSMLYAAAYFGAYVVGSDIDGRQMRGKSKSIKDSAAQYNITENMLDFAVYDLTQHPWRTTEMFDSIICDPPYGVRAGAKRLGRRDPTKLKEEAYRLPTGEFSHTRADYLPPSTAWEMSEVLEGVLAFSLRMLKPGGRLVYWLPTASDEYKDTDVPTLDGLVLEDNSCQDFGRWQRRLITMRKTADGTMREAQNGFEDGEPKSLLGHSQFRAKYFNKFA